MPVIALGGIKHTGKSTVGRIISETESMDFADLDDLIIELLPLKWTIRKWYSEKGADAFREKETLALKLYLEEEASSRIRILALGGGTLENPDALKLLKGADSRIIILQEEVEILFSRIIVKGVPPFLDTADPEASFRELYSKRTETLHREGDIIIDINGLDQHQAADRVIREIRKIDKKG